MEDPLAAGTDQPKEQTLNGQVSGDASQPKMMSGERVGTSGEAAGTNEDPRIIEHSADRSAVVVMILLTTASLLVEVLSVFTEAGRGIPVEPWKFTLYEASSVVVILALFPLLPFQVSRGFPGVHPWPRLLAVHGGGVLAFSIVHIAAMVALRKLFYPVFFEGSYVFTDNVLREFTYELRKDALTYVMGAGIVVLVREIAAGRKALSDAKQTASLQMLTYRSGGRTVMLPAARFLSARSEGNYAVLETTDGSHFVRTTLKGLLGDLEQAGVEAIRVHRSHIVAKSALREAIPTGNGDLIVKLEGGSEVPVSRRYRDALPFG